LCIIFVRGIKRTTRQSKGNYNREYSKLSHSYTIESK